jgi:pyrimidine operon attenuation protein/uracil phosphoribosyltransferase
MEKVPEEDNLMNRHFFQSPRFRGLCYFYKNYYFLKSILSEQQLAITIKRLAHQILETNTQLANTVLIGIQPRGIYLSDRVVAEIKKEFPQVSVLYGKLDITFYRDDVRQGLHIANQTDIPFSIENKKVVLVDDVLYTGRTIRAALDALLAFGRPKKVELCVLIDRRFSRQLPIQPDYVGKAIDSIISQKVRVLWKDKDGSDEVVILD